MRRRVVGIETEHGLLAAPASGDGPCMDAEHAARQLFEPLLRRGRSSNLFLRNGGRLYLDVGSHPEYATAECDRLEDLLEQDRAGSLMLADLASQADEAMAALGEDLRVHLFRNNLDSQGNSYGCHENYMLHRRRDFRQVADALVSFFITRLVLVGNGWINLSGARPRLEFSQRANQMWDAVSSATTRSRPIINTRDEPLADSGSYRRMHVIVGDTNVAEPTTALKIGMTWMLLDAVEDGLRIEDLALADPMRAIRQINADLSGAAPIELASGARTTPVALQREIRSRVLSAIGPDSLDEAHRYVADLWGRGLDAIESGDWSGVDTELDIAIKRRLLDSYTARTGADYADPRVARLELGYHDITAQGLRDRMEAAGLMKRLTSPGGASRALTAPPATTRARLRGAIIAAAEDARADGTVDTSASTTSRPGRCPCRTRCPPPTPESTPSSPGSGPRPPCCRHERAPRLDARLHQGAQGGLGTGPQAGGEEPGGLARLPVRVDRPGARPGGRGRRLRVVGAVPPALRLPRGAVRLDAARHGPGHRVGARGGHADDHDRGGAVRDGHSGDRGLPGHGPHHHRGLAGARVDHRLRRAQRGDAVRVGPPPADAGTGRLRYDP